MEVEMGVVPKVPNHANLQAMEMLKAEYMLTQVRGCVGGQLGWCLGPR